MLKHCSLSNATSLDIDVPRSLLPKKLSSSGMAEDSLHLEQVPDVVSTWSVVVGSSEEWPIFGCFILFYFYLADGETRGTF